MDQAVDKNLIAQFHTQLGDSLQNNTPSHHSFLLAFIFLFLTTEGTENLSVEITKLDDMIMGSENLSSRSEASEVEEKGAQKISVVHHQMNGLEYTTSHEADSFIVDIERFSSHLADKDISNANSRITLQRSLSRKGSQRAGGEKKIASSINTERHNTTTNTATSPRVTAASALRGAITPEKPAAVVVGAPNHSPSQPVHNAITIMTGCGGAMTTESKNTNRRYSFRKSSTSWTIDPRRILFFFATISSMGTILLIYFTLSMGKLSADDSGLN